MQKRPGNYRAQENLGKALIGAGRKAASLNPFREALRLFPKSVADPVLYVNLSGALADNGYYEESKRMFLKALALVPDDPLLHYNLGNSYMRMNDPANAVHAYRKALFRLAPPNSVSVLLLADLRIAQGRLPEAESLLTKAQLELPANADIQRKLVKVVSLRREKSK